MAKQSRVGMLIALLLLFMFGLVLSGLTAEETVVSPDKAGVADNRYIRSTQPKSINVTQRQRRRTVRRSQPRPDLTAGQMLRRVEPSTPSPTPIRTVSPRRTEELEVVSGNETYVVKSGDSLRRIARRVYGRQSEHLYKRIYEANRSTLSDPSRVRVGQTLVIPPKEAVREMSIDDLSRALRGGRTYTVVRGDTLTEIARKVYRSETRASVNKIYQANRNALPTPNSLAIGMTLRIPE
jgi:nucleoid-associated protein YgaU